MQQIYTVICYKAQIFHVAQFYAYIDSGREMYRRACFLNYVQIWILYFEFVVEYCQSAFVAFSDVGYLINVTPAKFAFMLLKLLEVLKLAMPFCLMSV